MIKIEADVLGSTPDRDQAHSLISASVYSISFFEKMQEHMLKHAEKVVGFDDGVHLKKERLTESHPTADYSVSDL